MVCTALLSAAFVIDATTPRNRTTDTIAIRRFMGNLPVHSSSSCWLPAARMRSYPFSDKTGGANGHKQTSEPTAHNGVLSAVWRRPHGTIFRQQDARIQNPAR